MQGFYRQVDAPSYPYTQESSFSFERELEIAFLTPSQVKNHCNYGLTRFPSDWRFLSQTYWGGELGIGVHDIASLLWVLIGSLTHHATFFQTLCYTM